MLTDRCMHHILTPRAPVGAKKEFDDIGHNNEVSPEFFNGNVSNSSFLSQHVTSPYWAESFEISLKFFFELP